MERYTGWRGGRIRTNAFEAMRVLADKFPQPKPQGPVDLDSDRGFLSGWPPAVVAVVNGQPVTRDDILDYKRERQARRLRLKRERTAPLARPCFVWVFYTPGTFYSGWWLYVRTAYTDYPIDFQDRNSHLILHIMELFPCGYLPMMCNFTRWKAAFAEIYHRPTQKRPERNGLALAQAVVSASGNRLITVRHYELSY